LTTTAAAVAASIEKPALALRPTSWQVATSAPCVGAAGAALASGQPPASRIQTTGTETSKDPSTRRAKVSAWREPAGSCKERSNSSHPSTWNRSGA
jgi:hypothetical protein